MTTAELTKFIGHTGLYDSKDGMRFRVLVTDAKMAYGNVRFKIEPVSGQLSAWVDSSRVSVSSTSQSEQVRP